MTSKLKKALSAMRELLCDWGKAESCSFTSSFLLPTLSPPKKRACEVGMERLQAGQDAHLSFSEGFWHEPPGEAALSLALLSGV